MDCRVVFAWSGYPPVRGACCPGCGGDLQQIRMPLVMPAVEARPLGAGEAEALRRYWRVGVKPEPLGLFEKVLQHRERVLREVALAKERLGQAAGRGAGEG